MISKKYFFWGAAIGLILLLVFIYTLPDRNLHIVFCNVGQGDAAYIRMPNHQDMLIDGGPDNAVLSCLGRHMPLYDRTIDLILLSHPHSDHLKGLTEVISRYKVNNLIKLPVDDGSKEVKTLNEEIRMKHIVSRALYPSDGFKMGEVNFQTVWPDKQYVFEHSDSLNIAQAPMNEKVLGVSKSVDLNEFSYYLHLSYGEFDTLFTGDADSAIEPKLDNAPLSEIEVLKVPHHGSKTSLTDRFLDKIKPKLAVISVGKNPWGHPTEETLKQLSDQAIEVLRTDREGDIEVVSDGKRWWVK
jgi:competence protein ComEC